MLSNFVSVPKCYRHAFRPTVSALLHVLVIAVCAEGEQPDVSRIFHVSSQTLTTVCQTSIYMTPAHVTPRVTPHVPSSDTMDSQVCPGASERFRK